MKVVFYHARCNDGLFAAYACWLKFGPTAIYIPVNYKPIQDMNPQEALDYIFSSKNAETIDSIGNSKYKVTEVTKDIYKDIELYIVDYSFPIDHFIYHCEKFKLVTVLDHHKTSIDSYKLAFKEMTDTEEYIVGSPFYNSNVVFSNNKSGAKLTYNYLFPEETIPDYFELVSDRDLWTFNLKHTKDFHSGIKALDISNFNRLDLIIKYGLTRILDIGRVFNESEKNYIEKIARSGTLDIDFYIDDIKYKGSIINSYLDVASDLCSYVISKDKDIVIAYYVKKDGSVSCSVRSKKEVDSSVISKAHGGGGHANASGFSISLDEWNKIITNKKFSIFTNNKNKYLLKLKNFFKGK